MIDFERENKNVDSRMKERNQKFAKRKNELKINPNF